MRDNINELTKQDANEGADGQKVLLQESQEFLFLNYSHDDDAAWIGPAGILLSGII